MLAGASWNLDTISGAGQVADDATRGRQAGSQGLQSRQCAADESDIHRLGFIVGEIEDGLSWVAVDKLYAENFSLRERRSDREGEVRGDGLGIKLFLDGLEIRSVFQVGRMLAIAPVQRTSAWAKVPTARRASRANRDSFLNAILEVVVGAATTRNWRKE